MVALPWVMSPLLASNSVLMGLHRTPTAREGLHLAVGLLGRRLASLERRHVRLAEGGGVVITEDCRLSHLRNLLILLDTACRWLTCCGCKVVVEHYIVIILLNVSREVEVLGKEAHQLVAWAVVGDESGLRVHIRQHNVEEGTSMTPSLNSWVYEEVKD